MCTVLVQLLLMMPSINLKGRADALALLQTSVALRLLRIHTQFPEGRTRINEKKKEGGGGGGTKQKINI